MIVEGYEIYLYCDCADCTDGREPLNPGRFHGNTKAKATKKARKAGWEISRDRMKAWKQGHRRKND